MVPYPELPYRIYQNLHNFNFVLELINHVEFKISNICFDFFKCACLKITMTNIRNLKFDMSKSMRYQEHKPGRIMKLEVDDSFLIIVLFFSITGIRTTPLSRSLEVKTTKIYHLMKCPTEAVFSRKSTQ